MYKTILLVVCLFFFNGCTINFTVAHTQGYANDLVDDTTEQKVDPTLSIPVKAM
jgi:hypothetical protein